MLSPITKNKFALSLSARRLTYSLAIFVLSGHGSLAPTPVNSNHKALIQAESKEQRLIDFSPSDNAEFVSRIIARELPKHPDTLSIASLIVTESAKHNVDPLLVTSIIRAESMFNKKAASNKGALGLMQIMPRTASYLAKLSATNSPTKLDLSDPQTNIRLGVYYITKLLSRYQGDHHQALIAYNWGPTNLARANNQNLRYPGESLSYARKVLQNYNEWSMQLAQYKVAHYAIALAQEASRRVA